MIAVLVGGDASRGNVEARHQLRVGMAAGTGRLGDVGQINRRLGIARSQNPVLAVAIRASGRGQDPRRHRLSVNALPVLVVNLGVARATRGGDVLLPDLRLGIISGENVVHAVAIVAGGGVHVALQDGAAVHALLVSLHGMGHREEILRGELGIRVAMSAGLRKVELVDGRFGIAGHENLVGGAMAAVASRGVAVHLGVGAPVDAFAVLRHLGGMAGGAELDTKLGGLDHIMSAMAGDAGLWVVGVTQHGVGARLQNVGHAAVTGCTGSRRRLRRVPGLCRSGVAVDTLQVLVDALLQDFHVDRDVFSLGVCQPAFGRVTG